MNKKEKEIIKLKIDSHENRTKLFIALAESGFKVWLEEQRAQMGYDYFVCFEKWN